MSVLAPAAPAPQTADAVRRRLTSGRADVAGVVFRSILGLAIVLTLAILIVLITDVVTGGWTVLSSRLGDFLTGELALSAERSGVYQGLIGSLYIGIFVVVLAFPIEIGAAIYLEEYAPKSRFTRVIDINIRNLAGVPSVVYGILGFAIFVKSLSSLSGGATPIAAGVTLAILVLPIVIITSAEAIRAVPDSIREAGFGVGATRWEVVRSHVLPYAAPGILTGTVLSLARALGEAAPLILIGAVTGRLGTFGGPVTEQLQEKFTAMPIVITAWAGRPNADFQALTAAAIVILLAVVLLFNTGAILLRNRYERRR